MPVNLLSAHELAHGYTRGGLLTRKHRVQVLRDLNLTLREGESVGLLGASGSGKSTLARLLIGVERPERGQVLFQDGHVETGGKAFLQSVQMVFQDAPSAFNPRLGVGWSIAEPLRHLRGLETQACTARVAELLHQVRLKPEDAHKLPSQMSGGQLQRAGLARALAAEPRLIILDEALSNLDRTLQLQMLELLADLRERLGTAFLLITHDLSLVRYFCQRVLLLAEGSIVEDRAVTPDMRFTHPAGQLLTAAMLPSEPSNAERCPDAADA